MYFIASRQHSIFFDYPLPRHGIKQPCGCVEWSALPEAHLSYQAGFLTHSSMLVPPSRAVLGTQWFRGTRSLYTVAGPFRHLT